MRSYTDWNCRLLHNMRDLTLRPGQAAEALRALRDRCGFRDIYLTPEYDCELESVPMFLLRRDHALRELRELLPQDCRVHAACCAVLRPGLSQTPALHRLRLPGTDCLPLRLPFLPDQPGIPQELNRLLYHSRYRLLLMSFDSYAAFYPPEALERLIALPHAVCQFGYQALVQPPMKKLLKALLSLGTPVLFGTGVNSLQKACYYEFDAYIRAASASFSESEREALFFRNSIPHIRS